MHDDVTLLSHPIVRVMRARASSAVRRGLMWAPAPVAGWLSGPVLRRWSPERIVEQHKLGRVFPELGQVELARLRAALCTGALRTHMADSFMRDAGEAGLRGFVDVSGLEHLRAGAAVLLSWHLGAYRLARPALSWSGVQSFVLTAARREEGDPLVAYVGHGSSVARRAAVLLRAVVHLRGGGRVMLMGDGPMGDSVVSVPVLGCSPRMRPGPALLAHLAQAPMHPITASWEGRRVHVRVHPALALSYSEPRDAFVRSAAHVIARWLEQWLRQSPLELTAHMIDWLLGTGLAR